MNSVVAFSTDRNNVHPIFSPISFIVVIFSGLRLAQRTRHLGGTWYCPGQNRVVDELNCLCFCRIFLVIFFYVLNSFFSRFETVFYSIFFVPLFALIIKGTDFAVIRKPSLHGLVFIKISYWLNCLAMSTCFCYNLFSHIRFLVTDSVRATFGLQPACGLIYNTPFMETVNA